jgi:lysophospholipase L1-like esterase
MLGTNDVKNTYNLSAEEIAEHLEQTIKLVRETEDIQQPQILVVCPPPVIMPSDGQLDSRMGRGIEMFKQLPPLYKKVAEKNGCDFIDAGDHISSSTIDGYHMDAGAHLKLAKVLNDFIISKFK